jgi:glyoxylase-like metal-dependent hydrolase (beta-lactamase superfamily II)/8-oxo-dGTP pyrophosphatase MutT (NUDIX family)
VLVRNSTAPEVLIVERSRSLRFFGGFLAFPGGKIHPHDAQVPFRRDSIPTQLADLVGTACRELFEETGVLLARDPDGQFPTLSLKLEQARRDVTTGRVLFGQVLRDNGLSISMSDFIAVGNLVTPPFAPIRFDTRFFLAWLPPGQAADVWKGELEFGVWERPSAILSRWHQGDCLISPPSIWILNAMADRPQVQLADSLTVALARAKNEPASPIYFSPQVELIPLRTRALPPSSHTNAFLIGRDPAYLLDPGPDETEEQERLLNLLEARRSSGLRLKAVLLSHHHVDHVGAAARCADRFSIPVWAHRYTAEKLAGQLPITREIVNGDQLPLGQRSDDQGPWALQVVQTPGHTPGHLVFYEPSYQLLFAGDMVSTVSSVIIAPPEGDLAIYLESLRLLRSYACRLLMPAHGIVSSRPTHTIDEWLSHRAKREEMLLESLSVPRTVAELAIQVYRGLPEPLMKLAELQVLAGLQKLAKEGRVQQAGEPDARLWESVSARRSPNEFDTRDA